MLKREKNVRESALPRFPAVKTANLDCRRPDALKPGFQCVTTHWNQGFIAFAEGRRVRPGPQAGAQRYPGRTSRRVVSPPDGRGAAWVPR